MRGFLLYAEKSELTVTGRLTISSLSNMIALPLAKRLLTTLTYKSCFYHMCTYLINIVELIFSTITLLHSALHTCRSQCPVYVNRMDRCRVASVMMIVHARLCAYVKHSTLNSAIEQELRDRRVEDRANATTSA